MKIKFKKLTPEATEPKKAYEADAAFDLTAVSLRTDHDLYDEYGTGLAFEIPEGYFGLIVPRSSSSKRGMFLSNSVGVIDSGYRGEVTMRFRKGPFSYNIGERIGQLLILPKLSFEFVESEELSKTDRGIGGYGSSGNF